MRRTECATTSGGHAPLPDVGAKILKGFPRRFMFEGSIFLIQGASMTFKSLRPGRPSRLS